MSFPLTPPSYQIVIFVHSKLKNKCSLLTFHLIPLSGQNISADMNHGMTQDLSQCWQLIFWALTPYFILMGYEHILTKTVMTCTLVPASGQTFSTVTFLALFKINNMSSNIFQTFILWGWITFLSPDKRIRTHWYELAPVSSTQSSQSDCSYLNWLCAACPGPHPDH